MSTIYNQRLWKGSSSHLAAVVHVAGRNDRPPHPIREKMNQIQSELKHMMQKTSHAISNRFFGNLLGGNDQNCGACCYSQGYNQGASNYNNQGQGFNHGSSNQAGRCQCDYSKTFTDQNGRTHGGCRRSAFIFTVKEERRHRSDFFLISRADESGRTWCYTTGWGNSGCGDLQSSRR